MCGSEKVWKEESRKGNEVEREGKERRKGRIYTTRDGQQFRFGFWILELDSGFRFWV